MSYRSPRFEGEEGRVSFHVRKHPLVAVCTTCEAARETHHADTVLIIRGEWMWPWTEAEAEGKEKMAPLRTVEPLPIFVGTCPHWLMPTTQSCW